MAAAVDTQRGPGGAPIAGTLIVVVHGFSVVRGVALEDKRIGANALDPFPYLSDFPWAQVHNTGVYDFVSYVETRGEGLTWAHGWDDETRDALHAANALSGWPVDDD